MKNHLKKIKYMFLFAGLGNKGKKYLDTRHNVGFNVIDKLVAHYEFKTEKKNLIAIHLEVL